MSVTLDGTAPSPSLVDQYLAAKEQNRKVRAPGVYYVTELCGPCIRDTVYGLILDYPADMESRRIFESGNMIEDWWLGVVAKTPGYTIIGRQLAARHAEDVDGDHCEIHGRIDALVQHPDTEIVIHEVKSQYSNLALHGNPKDEHAFQAGFYSAKTGVTGLSIDYLDKDAMLGGSRPVDLSFRVKADPGVLPELVARMRTVHGFIKARRLPPMTQCWKCRVANKTGRPYCRYSELCAEDADPWRLIEEGQEAA